MSILRKANCKHSGTKNRNSPALREHSRLRVVFRVIFRPLFDFVSIQNGNLFPRLQCNVNIKVEYHLFFVTFLNL